MIKINDDLFVNPNHVSHVATSPDGDAAEIWFTSGRYRTVRSSVAVVVDLLNEQPATEIADLTPDPTLGEIKPPGW